MKLYISYALASLLMAAPLMATDNADKTIHGQKDATQQDDEAASAPVYKKVAQILWKHKGKVALGTSVVILAALAYWYHDSLYALFSCDNHIEDVKDHGKSHSMTIKEARAIIREDDAKTVNEIEKIVVTQKDEPIVPVQENMQAPQSEVLSSVDVKELVRIADILGSEDPTLAIVASTPDKGIIVLPVLPKIKEQALMSLALIPVAPTTVSGAMPEAFAQESAQTSGTPSEIPVAADTTDTELTNADEVINSGNPWAVFLVLGKDMGLFPSGETSNIAETAKSPDVPTALSVDQTVSGDQQS